MRYADTTGVIIYWNPDYTFLIHISHHVWFNEYNSFISIEDKQSTGSILLQQYTESIFHYSYLLNLIPFELDLISTPFFYTTIITYEIELPPYVNKIGFNILDDEDYKIPYIPDTITNSPAGNQLPAQAKYNV